MQIIRRDDVPPGVAYVVPDWHPLVTGEEWMPQEIADVIAACEAHEDPPRASVTITVVE